jgi:dUTP pyrophosphatase
MNDFKIKLGPGARMPFQADKGCAGYDLFASEHNIIRAGNWGKISTSVFLEIPYGFYGRVAPRSGLAYKCGIDVFAGVIDSSYRGEIGVILYNASTMDFVVRTGDKVAQIIFEKCYSPVLLEVSELSDTSRGEGGFGSTGK